MPKNRRRYYRLTDSGLGVLSAETERMDRSVAQTRAKKLLPGETLTPIVEG